MTRNKLTNQSIKALLENVKKLTKLKCLVIHASQ